MPPELPTTLFRMRPALAKKLGLAINPAEIVILLDAGWSRGVFSIEKRLVEASVRSRTDQLPIETASRLA
jgi:hypothetical protein